MYKAPQTVDFMPVQLPPLAVETLPNGITLHIVNYGDQDIVRLSVLRQGGLFDMPDHNTRIALDVAAKTTLEGTEKLSGAQIADILDFNGARMGVAASAHHMCYDVYTLSSRLPYLFDVIAGAITTPALTDKSVAMVAQRLAVARATQLRQVSAHAAEGLQVLLAGHDHPAAQLPTPAQIIGTSAEDCRRAMAMSQKGGIDVFVGGKLDAAALDALRSFLQQLPPAPGQESPLMPYKASQPQRIHIEVPDTCQWAVEMGMPTIGREHHDYIPLRLAIMGLGGYFGSRLNQNIREQKGLTYGITAVLNGQQEGAYLDISAQCDAAHAQRLVDQTIHEIKRLAAQPPAGPELRRLRMHAWSALAATADSPLSVIDHYMTRLKVGTPADYFARQLEAIRTLDSATIANMARQYLDPAKLTIVTAG